MGAISAQKVDTSQRLARLRQLMQQPEYAVDAIVVPSEDAHSSEYPAHCDERRAFISGFTGSAGCAVITTSKAFLFTDGRYFLQADKQLDENWVLMKQGLPDVPTWQDFLSKNLEKKIRIGIDLMLITATDSKTLGKSLREKESELVPLESNLVDIAWGKERPARPANKAFPLDVKYAGQSFDEKLKGVRETLKAKNVAGVVVNMLDEVAWLFNLRGSDIDFNPVFFAFAVVTHDKALLFVNEAQLDEEARKVLGPAVEIRPYESIFDYLKGTVSILGLGKDKPLLFGDKCSMALVGTVGMENAVIAPSPVADMKAIKNATEIEGFRQCHIRDGAALVQYFSWLENQLNDGVELTESQAADKLEEFRSKQAMFKGLSFPTISSTGPNGAIIHYSPDPVDSAIVKQDQVYLCDSGAQFLDGTTDTTRTLHFGSPKDEEKRAFTRVLQGHIAIDTLVFPEGTTGYVIDSFARRPLWEDGLDYRHGTGHGVGHFLNVHEGPQGIGVRIAYNSTALKVGMTVSNEPGYYCDGKFGIRIENIVIVRPVSTPNKFGDKCYFGFEHVTMCPIQTKLVDTSLLSPSERKWLNNYHEEVYDKVSPLLLHDERALGWLKRECQPI